MLFRQPVRKFAEVVACRAGHADHVSPATAEYLVRRATIVPNDLFMLFRNLRGRHRQTAGIWPQENIDIVVPDELEHVVPSTIGSTAIVIPHQADGPRHTAVNRNTALSICMRLPEQNAAEGLLTLELKPAGNRNGKSDPDVVIAHNVGCPLTLRCAWPTLQT